MIRGLQGDAQISEAELRDIHLPPYQSAIDAQQGAGLHSMVFDGRGDAGSRLSSGVYHLRVKAEGASATQKLVLVK